MPHTIRAVTTAALVAVLALPGGCTPAIPSAAPPTATTLPVTTNPTPGAPMPTRIVRNGVDVVNFGEPIKLADLSGRILFDDFEDVYAMDVDGSNFVVVAGDPTGAEFDGAWSPDGEWIAYRDSTRGINEDDEIYVARADGSQKRNLTNNPANDWGPDWSPDGSTIVFNSDRDGNPLAGYLMHADGTNVRPIDTDVWFEYPSYSPDGSKIVFEGHVSGSYDLFIADVATGAVTPLIGGPGGESWPVWSPDGLTIAFTSERDDCGFAPPEQSVCWRAEDIQDAHRDTWLIDADGSNLRRVTSETSQFVAWSPNGQYLLVSGRALFVVRPDGTGRLELRTPDLPHALGGIPDWR
jgi:Tol biopolymer transport system component